MTDSVPIRKVIVNKDRFAQLLAILILKLDQCRRNYNGYLIV